MSPYKEVESAPTILIAKIDTASQIALQEISFEDRRYIDDARSAFRNVMGPIYSDVQCEKLMTAFSIASFHQINEFEHKRIRKEGDYPYLSHPLAMAQKLVELQQDPVLVAAALLHDIPEDMKLAGVDTPDAWLTYIDAKVRASGWSDAEASRLQFILQAETKTEKLIAREDGNEIISALRDSPLSQIISAEVVRIKKDASHGSGEITTEDDAEIASLQFDMLRNLAMCYRTGPDGQEVFDPGPLIVKMIDCWHNLQDKGFWLSGLSNQMGTAKAASKIVRARVYTNLAELMGYHDIASDMTLRLAKMQNLNNINNPGFGVGGMNEQEVEAYLGQAQAFAAFVRTNILGVLFEGTPTNATELSAACYMPWGKDKYRPDGVAYRPPLRARLKATPSEINHLDKESVTISYAKPRDVGVGDPVTVITAAATTSFKGDFLNALGRISRRYAVKTPRKNGGTTQDRDIGTLTIERDDQPTIAQTQQVGWAGVPLAAVCEYPLFGNPKICKHTMSKEAWDALPQALKGVGAERSELLAFLLSPRAYFERGSASQDQSFVIILQTPTGPVIRFVRNQDPEVTVSNLCEKNGIKFPASVTSLSGKTALVDKDNSNQITDMCRGSFDPRERVYVITSDAPSPSGRSGNIFASS